MSVMLHLCILCVALLIDMFVLLVACLTVFVNCFETIRNVFWCGCYFIAESYGCV